MKRLFFSTLCSSLLPPTAFAIVDTNNNGASDFWERSYNDDALFAGPFDLQADPDSDGWTNAEEAAAGTDPLDPNPPDGLVRPEIIHIPAVYYDPEEDGTPDILTPETMRIEWPTLVGKQYTLLWSADLMEGIWQSLPDCPFIGNGNIPQYNIPITQPDGSTPDRLFWRVSVEDVDTDGDTLTNAEEYRMGTNALLRDSDADGMDDNVDPEPNTGFDIFPDTDGDGIANADDPEPDNPDGVAPAISSETATTSRNINVAAGESLVFLVNVENPDGPPVTASNLKLFVSGTEDSATITSAGGNRFLITWTARVHADYPAKVLQNISVRFEDSRKATAWLDLARLDVAEWQGMVAGLAVSYGPGANRTYCIGGHSGGVQLVPSPWSGAYGTGPRWYRGPRNVKFYGRNFDQPNPGPELGTLAIGEGMRYPLFIIDETELASAPTSTVTDISDPVQYPHGYWGLNHWSGQIKMEGTGATSLIAAGTQDFIPLPQPGAEDASYTYDAKYLDAGDWHPVLHNIWPIFARTSSRVINALTVEESSSPEVPRLLEWGIHAPIEARIIASAAGSLEYPGLPLDNPQDRQPLFLAPNQWHRIVVKVGPDSAVVARGVRLRLNIGADGTEAAQNGFEFKHKTATGFETFTPGEIMEGTDLYNELIGQNGLVLFAKLPPTVDRLHRLCLDLLPNSSTLDPLEITKLELVPVDIDDIDNFATGVDDVSITADSSDIGYQGKFWIMAPCGNDPAGNRCADDTKFKIPMEPASKLRMDCTLANSEYRHPVDSAAASPAVPIGQGLASPVRWRGTGAESGDYTPIYKLGDAQQQVDLPVSVKVMKRRTVKVAVWPARLLGKAEIPIAESLKTKISEKLNQIFANQTNVWFEVTYKPGVNADLLDATETNPIGGGMTVTTEITYADGAKEKAMIEAHTGTDVDINVFLITTDSYRLMVRGTGLSLDGYSYISRDPTSGIHKNSSVVHREGDDDEIAKTLAHEIGHQLIGGGHPDVFDDLDPGSGGPAPLQSLTPVDHKKRMMCSGTHSDIGSKLLVKTEWDEAEEWLKQNIDKENQ